MSTLPPSPDTRTYNRQMLDAIRSVLRGKAIEDVAMYKYGGRELTHVPWNELLQAEAHYESLVRNERRRAAGKPRRGAQIVFGIMGSADTGSPRAHWINALKDGFLFAFACFAELFVSRWLPSPVTWEAWVIRVGCLCMAYFATGFIGTLIWDFMRNALADLWQQRQEID